MAEIKYLEINDATRMINVPANLLLGVMQDKNVERLYFRCKKIVGDHIDLSKHQIYIKYLSALDKTGERLEINEPGVYHCEDVTSQGDYITFSWLMSENVFKKRGFLAFSVNASDGETTRWNTFPAIGTVLITIPGGLQEVEERYPDIITQLLNRMDEVEAMATPEAMQGYVNTYLAAHPAEIDPELLDPKKCAPADVVGQLKKDIVNVENTASFLIVEENFSSDSIGYKFFEFSTVEGGVYEFTNNTAVSTSIETVYAENGDTVETVSPALYPNESVRFVASSNAQYIKILFQAKGNISVVKTNSAIHIIKDKLSNTEMEVLKNKSHSEYFEDFVSNNVAKRIISKNLISSYEFTDENITPDGEVGSSARDVLSDYLEVEPYRTISFTRIISGSASSSVRGKDVMSSIAFYDKNRSIISWISKSQYKLENTDVIVPANTKYVRFAFDKAYASTYKPMLEYVDNGEIASDFEPFFSPYIAYNEHVSNEDIKSYIDAKTYTVPYPYKQSTIKKSGKYNGCLSDIKTVDGKEVLYGFSGGGIVRSSNGDDKGSPNINISRPTSNGTVNFIKKLDDKTLLVGYESVDGYSRIYKGTPETWNASELKFDSTWSEVLVAETRGQRWSMWFGLSIHKNIIFVAEYGEHNVARNAYLSTDYGKTFTKVFTAEIDISGAGVHIHDVCYDPYSGMLWLCTGDGYWAQNVYFSYDMGTTWNKNYEYRESPSQFTSILPLPNCVLFVSDNSKHMAVYRCDRITLQNKPTHIELNEAYVNYNDYNAESPIGTNGCIAYGKDACAYFGWTERLDVVKTKSPVIGTKDGYNFYEVWNCGENFDQVSGSKTFVGIYGVYGVTENGNIGISFVKQEYGTTGMHSIIMPVQEWC